MNRCFSCGNKISENLIFHKKCLKDLFGVSYIPRIELSLNELTIKAQEMAGKLSISGVQAKLSIKLDKKSKKLISVGEGGEYILKPQAGIYEQLPENENLCMAIAGQIGLDIPPHALIKLKDGSSAFIIKRFDRKNGGKINQEDFCQVMGKSKRDKYTGSLEQIANKLNEISQIPGLDIQRVYERALFFFIIGNGDAHLKNYSINYTDMRTVRLSPAYDIVSSKLLIPGEEDCAITINGKKNNLGLRDFFNFSEKYNIPQKITRNLLDKKQIILDSIKDSQLNSDFRKKLTAIVLERFSRLTE
ncbi:MAG: HipA domain-containing protein [Candidatus Omnitrophica bacterium]|nr:HipA domain-containing protein [Candidatus Omnitrophota bacterium]MBU3929688.1 HipA domain-containing protein [bacterium]